VLRPSTQGLRGHRQRPFRRSVGTCWGVPCTHHGASATRHRSKLGGSASSDAGKRSCPSRRGSVCSPPDWQDGCRSFTPARRSCSSPRLVEDELDTSVPALIALHEVLEGKYLVFRGSCWTTMTPPSPSHFGSTSRIFSAAGQRFTHCGSALKDGKPRMSPVNPKRLGGGYRYAITVGTTPIPYRPERSTLCVGLLSARDGLEPATRTRFSLKSSPAIGRRLMDPNPNPAPRQAVARDLGYQSSYVGKLLVEARKNGDLGPARVGRAGELSAPPQR
jgi:hypothetical protein